MTGGTRVSVCVEKELKLRVEIWRVGNEDAVGLPSLYEVFYL
jgi:hypothetical protein